MTLNMIFLTKSTQSGGVQTLIKTIEKEALKEGMKVNEIYHKEPWSELYEEIEGVNYVDLNTNFKMKSFKINFIFNIYNARKELEKLVSKGDKIIIFSPNYLLYIPIRLLKNNQVILVQTNKMDVYFTNKSKIIFKIFHKYINYFAIFTPYDKKKLDSIFPNLITDLKEKIRFMPRACTIKPEKEPHKYGKNLIFIGRIMEDQKNFVGLIEIMTLLPKDFKLNIYGNGQKAEIDSLTEKLKGHENITFCGPTTNVKEKLENNNIFLMTSFYEGFANTLVEARSQGLPIIAYDTFESLRWIIKDGESGYAIPLGESQKFADAIMNIVSSKERYSEMSKAAIKMSESTEYSKIMGKWMDILKSE